MKIGMLTGLWFVADGAGVVESLRQAASLGFRYVDLHGVFHAGPAHLSPSERQAVRAEMTALGLEPRNYVLHAPHNLASASDGEFERSFAYLSEGIDLAAEWGVSQLMLNAGQWAYGVSREAAWSRAVHFLQRVCDYARPRGVYIAQEAEPYVWFLVNDITSTVRMLEDVDRPNLATLVDLGHMALAREGPADLARLGDTIIHGHLSDHLPLQHTNQAIGTGSVPFADYLHALQAMGIDRRMRRFGYDEFVLSFELGAPGDRIAAPADMVRRSLEHMRSVAPYLTQS